MTTPPPYLAVLIVTALALSGVPGTAQQADETPAAQPADETPPAQQADETPRWPAVFHDTAEVRVVNVEVFVSDAAGRPVTGLEKDDFQLLVDGEPVAISHFYAVEGRGGAPAAPEPEASPAEMPAGAAAAEPETRLYLAIFVDNPSIRAAHRERVFRQLREFVLAQRRPDVYMMVASRDLAAREPALAGSPLVIRQDFTQVPHEIFVALDDLRKRSAADARFAVEERQLLRSIEALNADLGRGLTDIKGDLEVPLEVLQSQFLQEAQSLLPQIQAYGEQRHADALRTLGILAQMADLLAPLPGRKALVYVSDGFSVRPGEEIFEAYANHLTGVAPVDSDLSSQLEADRFDVTPDLRELVARANAGRVTFYTLNASPPAAARRGAAEAASFTTGAMDSVAEAGRLATLELMAGGTGGRAGLAPAALAATLAGVLTDFDQYYSLGYVSAEPGGEREARRLEVRLGDSRLRVRHRESIRERSSEESMTERVLSALVLDPASDNPLGIAVGVGEAKANDDGFFVVPLRLEVPLGRLVLVPGRREHEARVTMYVAARDGAGRTSGVTRHLCPIRIPNSEVLLALGRTMACGVRLLMRPGGQTVAVAVRDEVAGTAAVVRLELEVAGPPAAGDEPAAPGAGDRR